jgi:hypothetical protein
MDNLKTSHYSYIPHKTAYQLSFFIFPHTNHRYETFQLNSELSNKMAH